MRQAIAASERDESKLCLRSGRTEGNISATSHLVLEKGVRQIVLRINGLQIASVVAS